MLNGESIQLNLYRARIYRLPVKQRFQIVSIHAYNVHIYYMSIKWFLHAASKQLSFEHVSIVLLTLTGT